MVTIVTLTLNPAIDDSTSVDRLHPFRKLRCRRPDHDPGGGGINVSRVIQRLGGDVIAIYPAGGDSGGLLNRLVAAEGVRGQPVQVQEETRRNLTVFETGAGVQYRFVMPGPELMEPEWTECLDAAVEASSGMQYLVMSGSIPPGVPADAYARVAARAKSSGVRVVVDSSGSALAAALDEGIYLVKPNLRELRDLTGQDLADEASRIAACRQLVDAGQAEIVALSMAEQGALLVTRADALHSPGLKIDVVSTVGAGDSFVAALVWSLASDRSIEEAFRLAVAAGSAALLAPGTELARVEDMRRLATHVTVCPIPAAP